VSEDLQGVFEFISRAGALKRVRRKGWVAKLGVERAESVADHTYRTALISLILAELEGLDSCRAVRMVLIHDLAESVTGDLTPEEKGELDEAKILSALIDALPPGPREGLRRDAEELRSGSGLARLVRDADRLEMCLQALEYAREGYPKGELEEFIESGRKDVEMHTSKRLLGLILRKWSSV